MQFPFDIPFSFDDKLMHRLIEQRLEALTLFNEKFVNLVSPFPVEAMLDALITDQKLPSKMTGEKSPYHLNDFDIAESFIAYTFCNEAKYPDDFILTFASDQSHIEGEDDIKMLRQYFKAQGELLRQLSYPRIRAKLIFWELVTIINKDESVLMDLITLCPEYLGSSYLKTKVHDSRFKLKYQDKDDLFLTQLSRAIKGDLRAKFRKYNYWEIDTFYSEFTEGVKAYNQFEDGDKEEFLKDILEHWNLSEDLYTLIVSEPKKYSQHCLSALIEKNLIPDATTYTHIIQPYLKIIKENVKYINACPMRVKQLLDIPFNHPSVFERVYIWNDISSYDFSELRDYQPDKCLFHLGSMDR